MSEIVTTSEAAGILGVTEQGVRMLVLRGELEPLERATRPLTFWAQEVVELEFRRRKPAERERISRLAAEWVDVPP